MVDNGLPPHVIGARVLRQEAASLLAVADRLDVAFDTVVGMIANAAGRVIVTGLGKSGLVGAKIAATLASTGTVASFVHSADALHGDAGMITPQDVVIAISNSGSTAEVVRLASMAGERGALTVAVTRGASSPLACACDQTLLVDPGDEADPLGLAPTSSTTAVLAVGDALAIALMDRSAFSAADFAVNHPGGALGDQLQKASDA